MEGQQTEPLTWPSQNYASSFFSKVPLDSRFLNSNFQKIVPSSIIDGKTITFACQRFDAPNVYNFFDTCLELTCAIVKSDGQTLPAKSSVVGPINYLLLTAFKNLRIKINEFEITKQSSLYPFKCYISAALTYSSYVKSSQLQSSCYYSDLSNHFGPESDNTGFLQRSSLFRKDYQPENDFRPGGTTLFGR
jgi:hypothetical protein